MSADQEVLDRLDSLGGWKALIRLTCDAKRAVQIVSELSIIGEGGKIREGTLATILNLADGVMAVVGGRLTDREGAELMEWCTRHKAEIAESTIIPPEAVAERLKNAVDKDAEPAGQKKLVAFLADFNRRHYAQEKKNFAIVGGVGCGVLLLIFAACVAVPWVTMGFSWWILAGVAVGGALVWLMAGLIDGFGFRQLEKALRRAAEQAGIAYDRMEMREALLSDPGALVLGPKETGLQYNIMKALGVPTKQASEIHAKYSGLDEEIAKATAKAQTAGSPDAALADARAQLARVESMQRQAERLAASGDPEGAKRLLMQSMSDIEGAMQTAMSAETPKQPAPPGPKKPNLELRKILIHCQPAELAVALNAKKSDSPLPQIHRMAEPDEGPSLEKTTETLEAATLEDLEWAVKTRTLSDEADRLAEAGQHAQAIPKYEAALDLAPFDAIATMSLGVCYATLGNGQKAVPLLERAAQLDPANQRIRGNLEAVKSAFGL